MKDPHVNDDRTNPLNGNEDAGKRPGDAGTRSRSGRRSGRAGEADVAADVVKAVPTVRPGQVLACSMSLLCAGVLLTRGFIGLVPGRPVYVVLGVVLAASALWALSVDHITLKVTSDQPADVLAEEMNRSRRFGHPLTVVQVRCDEATGRQIAVSMRVCDRAWHRRGVLSLMLVETDADGARSVVQRVAEVVPADRIRVATFPDDTLTLSGLLEPTGPASLAAVAERTGPTGTDVTGTDVTGTDATGIDMTEAAS